MIKKINLILIITSIVGSIYFIITRDNKLLFILKDLSIILTINALYIIEKLFKVKFNVGIKFIYILFIFMAHFLGVICEFYSQIYWFDKFTHFLSGIVSSFGAIYVLYKCKKNNNVLFNVVFIISVALAVASLWEIFEYTSSCLFSVDPQKVALTGVNDTMKDIIVAFLGSLSVSLSYIFEVKYNHNFLINKYIKLIN